MSYDIEICAIRPHVSIIGYVSAKPMNNGGTDAEQESTCRELFDELQRSLLRGSVEHIVLYTRESGTVTSEVILRHGFYLATDCALTMHLQKRNDE